MSDVSLIACLCLFILTGCPEGKCTQYMKNSNNFQTAFDHCMDKAATISKSGTHDNTYNTVEECENYAHSMDEALCDEKAK